MPMKYTVYRVLIADNEDELIEEKAFVKLSYGCCCACAIFFPPLFYSLKNKNIRQLKECALIKDIYKQRI